MPKVSAGVLLYRKTSRGLEVFLVHPGGPLWKNKDEGAWSIPKGLIEEGEDLLQAALREFEEETGFSLKPENPTGLSPVKLKSGKTVYAFAIEGDCEAEKLRSNTFRMEWPPKSGMIKEFPEIDRGGWFSIEEAKRKINPGQISFLSELEEKIKQ